MSSTFLQGVIISSGTVGALLGSIMCWFVADDLGRRWILLLASFLFMVGAFLQFIAGIHALNMSAGFSILFFGSLSTVSLVASVCTVLQPTFLRWHPQVFVAR